MRGLPNSASLAVVAAVFAAVLAGSSANAQVAVTTYHNDNARTGQNLAETLLTPGNVNPNTFGLVQSRVVDGYVYAQPLYLSGVAIPGQGKHNVVYVATEHDSVYAFDADSANGQNAYPLWQDRLVFTNASTVPNWEVGSDDIVSEIGITGTPVIDPQSGTLYVVAKSQDANGFTQRLHALDIATGRERFGGPVTISATVAGTGDGSDNGVLNWDPLRQMNRSALILINGVVYIAFGSHGDNTPYHGWLLGYDAHTLEKVSVFNASPNAVTDPGGYPLGGGAIWSGGGGVAADSTGNIFVMTGNGVFDADQNGLDFGDSFVRIATPRARAAADYFTPYNQQDLTDSDADLGSGGPILLPDSVGSSDHPHLMVGCGKQGTIYLVDRDSMGGYNPTADANLQQLYGAIGGDWGSPAYFNGAIYYSGIFDVLKSFSIAAGALGSSPSSAAPTGVGYPGSTPSISANGTQDGIVWTIQADAYSTSGPAILHAYDATNVATELYNSTQVAADSAGPAVKFTVPTIANGEVFVGGEYTLSVYGLR